MQTEPFVYCGVCDGVIEGERRVVRDEYGNRRTVGTMVDIHDVASVEFYHPGCFKTHEREIMSESHKQLDEFESNVNYRYTLKCPSCGGFVKKVGVVGGALAFECNDDKCTRDHIPADELQGWK